MNNSLKNENGLGQVIYLILILGVLTNISIVGLLIYLSAFQVLYSPIVGTIVFVICFRLVLKNRLTVKVAFLITAYTVAFEVIIHTHFLGWDAGYFYFFYALSIVFLLDYSWRLPTVILFNGSMIGLLSITYFLYKGELGAHFIPANFTSSLFVFNQAIIGLIILIIIIYASHTNKIKDKALKLTNQELSQQNKEILDQRNHLEILLKEVHHRVKNNLQIISSLLSLQQSSIKDESIISILNESKTRVGAIALIHQNLYNNNTGSQVDFNAYLNDLVNSQQIIQSNIQCQINSSNFILELDIAVPLGLIVSEMMTNSVKHAFERVENPKIEISFTKEANNYVLIYRDNGVGLSEDFKLLQPETLGMEIITALISQINAEIDFTNDSGAVFTICF